MISLKRLPSRFYKKESKEKRVIQSTSKNRLLKDSRSRCPKLLKSKTPIRMKVQRSVRKLDFPFLKEETYPFSMMVTAARRDLKALTLSSNKAKGKRITRLTIQTKRRIKV